MNLASSTILVTGGATGIGLGLAQRFLAAGSQVIVCGRRESALREAQTSHPELHVRVCDVQQAKQRAALADWVCSTHPQLNVLVNNAGIQNRVTLIDQPEWTRIRQELGVNLEAPIHLTTLLLPHLQTRADAAVINVTSGLAFVPMAAMPIYCATKAALHSFTVSLRAQLAGSSVDVIEIVPPAVNTDLGGPGLHTFGVPLDEFSDAAFVGLERGEQEITYGFSTQASRASRDEVDAMSNRMNQAPR